MAGFVLFGGCLAILLQFSGSSIIGVAGQNSDPCAEIGSQTYVAPSKVLKCLNSFAFNTTLRNNIVDVVSKTLNFHTSVNYQLSAPAPFTDVHSDILAELAKIRQSEYNSDYALHLAVSSQMNQLFDGHCVYINYCYDSTYLTYLPFPLVNVNSGSDLSQQDIYISPQAFDVVSDQLQSFIDEWQSIAGYNFAKYSGAKVLEIDGLDPWVSVEAIAASIGTWQGRSSRQNSFFSSYTLDGTGWSYRMGDFALRSLPPTTDYVNLTVLAINSTTPETIMVPFISQIATWPFTSGKDLWRLNCLAIRSSNGMNLFPNANGNSTFGPEDPSSIPVLVDPSPRKFAESIAPQDRNQPISSIVDLTAFSGVSLPSILGPPNPTAGSGSAQFYIQGKVGILALGSFSAGAAFANWFRILPEGFNALKNAGITHLIIDVTNNSGGFICVANFLHRFLAGPKSTTQPQGGLNTKARYNTLASNITQAIASGAILSRGVLIYDPARWYYANSSGSFPQNYNWLETPEKKIVNGRDDAFSQTIGEECEPYPVPAPNEAYLPMENIGIVSNGRCGSSCAVFTTVMAKKEGVRTAVVGGHNSTTQQYAGTIGGQSVDFTRIDSEVKSTHLKNHPLAPPDFLGNYFQGITWRLALSTDNPNEFEEWQDHPADDNIPLTLDTVNKPSAIWKSVAAHWWPDLQ